MNEALSLILAKFSTINDRSEATKELCLFFGASDLLIFYFDIPAAAYLPAPGFPQTIRNMSSWQAVLKNAENKDFFEGHAIFENESASVMCIGRNKCYLMLVNPTRNQSQFKQLQQIFSLLASLVLQETQSFDLKARMKNADIAKRKAEKLATSLDIVTNKLQRALRTEEEFLSVASHELKTPVTSLSAFVHVLLELYPVERDEKTNKILTRIKFQIERMIELIANLLDTSKIDLNGLVLEIECTHLDPIIREAIDNHLEMHPEREILLTGSTTNEIACDKNRLGQVINNLLANAIKYSDSTSKVLVELSDNDKEVHVLVRDFGIGIDKNNLPNVFVRFFRAHGADSGRLSSLGLGLYIAEDIIKRHKGKIWVESEPGHGSTFHFTLPVAECA